MMACEEGAHERHLQDALTMTMTALYLEFLRINTTITLSAQVKTDFDQLCKLLTF